MSVEDELLDVVRACIADVLALDATAVAPGATLLSLGAQSIDFLSIIARLERQLGIVLAREFTLPAAYSVSDLAIAAAAGRSRPL